MRNLSPAQGFRRRRKSEASPHATSVAKNALRDTCDNNHSAHLCRSARRHNLTPTTQIATRCLLESCAGDNLQKRLAVIFLSPFLAPATEMPRATN